MVVLWFLLIFLLALLGMGAVAFMTLMERKILGLTQVRLGPNKVTFAGVLQPLADGVKLLLKHNLRLKETQLGLYFLGPMILLGLFLSLWVILIPWMGISLISKHNSLLYFSLLGVGAYAVILTGWSSTSGFSKLGSMRGILQSLSYEVTIIIIFVLVLFLSNSLNFVNLGFSQLEILLGWLVIWLVLLLMESNRAPFDLLEGESELISGFNIEMGSVMFVYIFLSEYGMVMMMAAITSIVTTGEVGLLCLLVMTAALLLRSCFPRVRYDSLMGFMWQCVLPMSIGLAFIGFFL